MLAQGAFRRMAGLPEDAAPAAPDEAADEYILKGNPPDGLVAGTCPEFCLGRLNILY